MAGEQPRFFQNPGCERTLEFYRGSYLETAGVMAVTC